MLLRRADNTANPVKKLYFRQEGNRLLRFEQRVGGDFALHIACSDIDGERLREIGVARPCRDRRQRGRLRILSPYRCAAPSAFADFRGHDELVSQHRCGLFLLQQLWRLLRARFPEVTFDIVGANPPTSVISAARELEGVTVHGFVKDVRPMVESATLFVCPIRDGGGTKLKILDAFAMNKCVVAHPVACEGIDVTPGTHVEFAIEPAEWIERIATLLDDADLRARRGAAARVLVEQRYSFDAIGARLSELFDQVAARGATPSASR